MSTAKINIKNIDYFKYRRLVIDANRDDYAVCSREVKSLCDAVQTLTFRDDEFDDATDAARFNDVCTCYRQILASKRIDPVDMRLKSGWWGEPGRSGAGYSAGKIKSTQLLDVLSSKSRDWTDRHHDTSCDGTDDKLEGRGLYVFKHRDRQCFQLVGRADNVFVRCSELLKAAFDGTANDPLSALLVISLASDWDFYFISVQSIDGERLERILLNDLILKHDSIWPHGLNLSLHLDSLIEVTEFRRSCLRHHWPPEYDTATRGQTQLDLEQVRRQLAASDEQRTANGRSSTVAATDTRDQSPTHQQTVSVDMSLKLITKATSDVTSDTARVKTKSRNKMKDSNQTTTTAHAAATTTNTIASSITTGATATNRTSAVTSVSDADPEPSMATSTNYSNDVTLRRSSTYTSLATDDNRSHTLPHVF